MTPVRIRNLDLGATLGGLVCISAVLLFFGYSIGGQIGLRFCALIMLAWSAFLAPSLVLWIDIGPRLAYRTLFRVHTHQWTDVKAIQFTHVVLEVCESDGPGDAFYYCHLRTDLEIAWTNNRTFKQEMPYSIYNCTPGRESSSNYGFDGCRQGLVRGLIEALRHDDACIRCDAAHGLGKFRPDAVCDAASEDVEFGYVEAKAMAQSRAVAFKALLDDAILNLKRATLDPDADVREAATEALRRTEQNCV